MSFSLMPLFCVPVESLLICVPGVSQVPQPLVPCSICSSRRLYCPERGGRRYFPEAMRELRVEDALLYLDQVNVLINIRVGW